jgi:hypothetical protein
MAKNGFLKKTFRKAKTVASKKYEEYKKESAYKRAAESRIKKKAKEAGYRAKETQAIRYAQEKEKYKTSQRLKTMKRPGTSFSQGLSYITGPSTLKGKGNGSSMNRMLGTNGGNGMNTLLFGKQPRSKTTSKNKYAKKLKKMGY